MEEMMLRQLLLMIMCGLQLLNSSESKEDPQLTLSERTEALEKKIGWGFRNKSLLKSALVYEKGDFSTLEHLGDKIVGLAALEEAQRQAPKATPKSHEPLVQQWLSNKALSKRCVGMGLGTLLEHSHDPLRRAEWQERVYGSFIEAIVGAIFKEASTIYGMPLGRQVAINFVKRRLIRGMDGGTYDIYVPQARLYALLLDEGKKHTHPRSALARIGKISYDETLSTLTFNNQVVVTGLDAKCGKKRRKAKLCTEFINALVNQNTDWPVDLSIGK